MAKGYYVEAKWFIQGYMPPFEEYLRNGFITSASGYLLAALFLGMKSVIKEDYEWLIKKPKMVVATQIINRLLDDLGSYEVR